jgi:hypothetical protein
MGPTGDRMPVAGRWFAIEDCGAGVSRIYEPAMHRLIQEAHAGFDLDRALRLRA